MASLMDPSSVADLGLGMPRKAISQDTNLSRGYEHSQGTGQGSITSSAGTHTGTDSTVSSAGDSLNPTLKRAQLDPATRESLGYDTETLEYKDVSNSTVSPTHFSTQLPLACSPIQGQEATNTTNPLETTVQSNPSPNPTFAVFGPQTAPQNMLMPPNQVVHSEATGQALPSDARAVETSQALATDATAENTVADVTNPASTTTTTNNVTSSSLDQNMRMHLKGLTLPRGVDALTAAEVIANDFQLVRYLGSGSYGSVVMARCLRTNSDVAIKRVATRRREVTVAKRVLREVRILRLLDHENVIGFKGVLAPLEINRFEDLHLAFEYIDTDMQKLIHSDQFFTPLHVKYFTYQLLSALAHVHRHHIIHRDVKPANILVNADCSLRLCDFGLARSTRTRPNASRKVPVGFKEETAGVDVEPGNEHGLQGVSPSDPTQVGTNAQTTVTSVPTAESDQGTSRTQKPSDPTSQAAATMPTPKGKRQLTRHVATRWYRAPELILLEDDYTASIDMWSVGCILAELLMMIKETVPLPKHRTALFPGRSCFPLSAETTAAHQDVLDQLNVIFEVIGTPTPEEITRVPLPPASQEYLSTLAPKPRIDFTKRFPNADPDAIDLLEKLLQFDPASRPTAEEALKHPFFAEVRAQVDGEDDPGVGVDGAVASLGDTDVSATNDQLYFEFEDEERLHPDAVRALLVEQILIDNPHLQESYLPTEAFAQVVRARSSQVAAVSGDPVGPVQVLGAQFRARRPPPQNLFPFPPSEQPQIVHNLSQQDSQPHSTTTQNQPSQVSQHQSQTISQESNQLEQSQPQRLQG